MVIREMCPRGKSSRYKEDHQTEAHGLAAADLVQKGENLARNGNVDEAIASFQKANQLSPTLQLDAEGKAKKLATSHLVRQGRLFSKRGKIREAMTAYTEAQKFDPQLSISAESLHLLCWNGSLWGFAADVISVCEQTVDLNPEDAGALDSRGVARALTGNIAGAIEDFQEFIDWISDKELIAQRQRWIDTLRGGQNPFTPAELEKLRNQ